MNSLERAEYHFVLEGQGCCHEEKVEDEHRYAQQLGHLPAGEKDAGKDQEEHGEEEDNGAAEASAGDSDRMEAIDEAVEEPRER